MSGCRPYQTGPMVCYSCSAAFNKGDFLDLCIARAKTQSWTLSAETASSIPRDASRGTFQITPCVFGVVVFTFFPLLKHLCFLCLITFLGISGELQLPICFLRWPASKTHSFNLVAGKTSFVLKTLLGTKQETQPVLAGICFMLQMLGRACPPRCFPDWKQINSLQRSYPHFASGSFWLPGGLASSPVKKKRSGQLAGEIWSNMVQVFFKY